MANPLRNPRAICSPRPSLNINSHHYGFGHLDIENFMKTSKDSVATHRDPSNKFKEKLVLKQRKAEELVIANRIKRLANEEERLKK